MVTNVVNKSLAGAEDILRGVDTVTQIRNGNAYEMHQVHAPVAVSSEANLTNLNPAVATTAVIVAADSVTYYNYNSTDTSGITSLFGGSWLIYKTLNSEYTRWRADGDVRGWGAKLNGVDDDTAAIKQCLNDLVAIAASTGRSQVIRFPSGNVRTSEELTLPSGIGLECSSRAVFQGLGDKTFPCWNIVGGGRKITFGTIDNYMVGIRARNNTNDISFQTVSNCVDGVVLRASSGNNNLDNVIKGIQIGLCTNGIVFEQNADKLVQQGNEVRVNFISETTNGVVFRTYDNFVHTQQSNWDSNLIELQALDPLNLAGASFVSNQTDFAVPNLKASVKSWLGGTWVYDSGTFCTLRGRFSEGTFEVSTARGLGLNEVVTSEGKNSFGSCEFKITRSGNLGSGTNFYDSVPPGSVFNGGVPVAIGKFRVRCTVPDLAADQMWCTSIAHILSQVNGIGRVRLVQATVGASSKYVISVTDAGTETYGMVRIWFGNFSSALITGRTVDLILEAY